MGNREGTVEDMVIDESFWNGKRVFLTGHTGFKGGWACILLSMLNAKVYGFSLPPTTENSFFKETRLENFLVSSKFGDIRSFNELEDAISVSRPEIVIHMAAQPLVRESYKNPLLTLDTNIMGTANLLHACVNQPSIETIINITSDKCYENRDWPWPYREIDDLGGNDIYSSSKACSELITKSFRLSFNFSKNGQIATARAGNVIGGGDWAEDRLLPDFFRALENKDTFVIRSPGSIRPWQHVLEPIFGYVMLIENLTKKGKMFAGPWNFGPNGEDERSVEYVVRYLCKKFPGTKLKYGTQELMKEARLLKLDSSKSKMNLGWFPNWNLDKALSKTIEWYENWKVGADMAKFTKKQIKEFLNDAL